MEKLTLEIKKNIQIQIIKKAEEYYGSGEEMDTSVIDYSKIDLNNFFDQGINMQDEEELKKFITQEMEKVDTNSSFSLFLEFVEKKFK